MRDALKYKLEIEKRPLPVLFVVCMLLAACICAGGVTLWKPALDARAIQWKSQSSFYSSLGRAQAAHRFSGNYDTSFLGSSITGRIPGVESGYTRWANLGIDASSAEEGLRLMAEGITPVTPIVVVEADRLFAHLKPVSANPHQDFGAGPLRHIPFFTPLYRSSTLLWTELRRQKYDAANAAPYKLLPLPEVSSQKPSSWTQNDEQVLQMMRTLQQEKAVRFCIAVFPNKARRTGAEMLRKTAYVASELGVPYYDLNAQIPAGEKIEFSDGIHMECQYAIRVAATLYEQMHR